ncbi:MAG: hypothetical protein QOJ39_3192 [Candidatus Eremiobacteraeota bacterium]|jgi:hypothetical protein|nr:hypothetical protein [Candidatus Eremiobacteraeota bacterium]
MALHIENAEADRLAHELSAATGDSVDEAVVAALRGELERVRPAPSAPRLSREEMLRRVDDIVARISALPDVGTGDPNDCMYDDHGAPN